MIAVHEATIPTVDDHLVARCRNGDKEAFALVYAQYERQIFRYAYHIMGNRDDADEIKQETFVKAYLAIGGFRSEASLITWLLRICGNLCRDRLKSWERRKVHCDARLETDSFRGGEEGEDPYDIVERNQVNEMVMKALQGMPAPQREILVLHEIEDRSQEEIAQILGCSRTCVKLRLFRARRALKERVTSLLKVKD